MNAPFFAAAQYQRATPVDSYWRAITPTQSWPTLANDLICDVAIIGGGLNGLSTALHLSRDHHIDTIVLEAGDIAWGASGRNGGFNTMPAMKLSVSDLFKQYGEIEAIRFLQSQREATDLVAQIAQQENIDLQRSDVGVISVAHKPSALDGLQTERQAYLRAGLAARLLSRDECHTQIHRGSEVFGALHLQHGFGLNPLAFCDGLARRAAHHGSRIYAHSAVLNWQKHDGFHVLHTANGTVRARRLVLAMNAYRDLIDAPFTQARFIPAISNIIVTEKIADVLWQQMHWHTTSPIANTKHLLHYYRRLNDGRLLLGARGDLSGSAKAALQMRAQLTQDMRRLFPAFAEVKVDYFWNGLVSLSPKMLPTFGQLPDDQSVYFNLGCFGNGVNTMPWIGRAIARTIASAPLNKLENASAYKAMPSRLPSSRFLQRCGLQLAYWHYALRDRYF